MISTFATLRTSIGCVAYSSLECIAKYRAASKIRDVKPQLIAEVVVDKVFVKIVVGDT